MANTKNLDRAARLEAKKAARKKTKALYNNLTTKEKKKWRSFDEGGFKQFLESLEKSKAS